ncbi:PEPxxWA-CTERM sorting domain-containing protein [Sandaracinobacteroides saxicola]|uniref:PEPxxWA-CTERM sorting domain-containing protein n=1 Tax=Sandaracinobacteroides saxicola TaxID=2759707 RepID=A0A7G5IDR1_9SPHN|nr:PEPxxWA-CTERM sorting domain-containing protein [Sandaracinobacteroides saxicola]QMW21503.1 PEPxxWA-CTERM sorting domain-containing protein [Sandaracinobacteroides saxicola]
MIAQASLKQLCVLLAAGGIGAGTTVAVQTVAPRPKPAVVKTAAAPMSRINPAAQQKVSLAQKPVNFTPAKLELADDGCSSQDAALAQLSRLQPVTPPDGTRIAGLSLPIAAAVPGTNGVAPPSPFNPGGGIGGGISGGGGGSGSTSSPSGIGSPGERAKGPVEMPTVPMVPAVPEPQVWALMIIGYGLVGWMVRKRLVAA